LSLQIEVDDIHRKISPQRHRVHGGKRSADYTDYADFDLIAD
jgi:hypothetical protein